MDTKFSCLVLFFPLPPLKSTDAPRTFEGHGRGGGRPWETVWMLPGQPPRTVQLQVEGRVHMVNPNPPMFHPAARLVTP